MSVKEKALVGALVRGDGRLQPVPGPDPSAQGTYREDQQASPKQT